MYIYIYIIILYNIYSFRINNYKLYNIPNRFNKLNLNSLSSDDEEKLEDLLGKKISDLSNKELLNEIMSLNNPSVDATMDEIFDIDKLPSLETIETLEKSKKEIADEDFYDPTVGEFKMKYSTEEERINMAKNAVTHILEDNKILAVPIKRVLVNNDHIETLFWRDSHKYIEIWIPLRNKMPCNELDITFSTDNVKVTNGDLVILDLPLPGPIRADECVWESVNKSFPELPIEAPQTIHIVLTKRTSHKHIWKSLVRK